jgi:Na+-transporting methylmalonyl-CoA/oxaloacetate decarboxylase gamma subunit
MHNIINLTNLLVSGVENQSKEVLMVVLPIVGISVVLASLAFLALILKQFIFIEKDSRKAFFAKPEAPVIEKETAEKVETEDESSSEDEIAAISTAIYLLMQGSADPIALTEIPVENSPWVAAVRNVQSAGFKNWKANKR